jgi:N-acetylglucosamine-6-phosphate deacetylase
MRTFIINGILITPEEQLDGYALVIENDRILGWAQDCRPDHDDRVIDAGGRYVAPGFIDIHTHGAGGHDFMDGTEEAFREAALTHMRHGTCALVPTTLAAPDVELAACFRAFALARLNREGPRLLGMHMEGPYISMEMRGAQDPSYIREPSPDHIEKILKMTQGSLLRWTLAPELPGICELGGQLRKLGIFPSIGHSSAYYEEVLAAFDNGFRTVTHLYSGMSAIRREKGLRRLGVIETALLLDGMMVEVIADGVHLPPELLRLILKTKGSSQVILVTDAMRAAGQQTDRSILGSLRNGQPVVIEDDVAKLPDRTALAGSIATADRLVRVMVRKAGVPLADAVRMITLNPAKAIGMEHDIGSLEDGHKADLVFFDDDINITRVIIGGEVRI